MFEPTGPKPIQGYQDWYEEFQACKVWDRPPRKFHTDLPTYPWAPKPAPDQVRISFKLNFQ